MLLVVETMAAEEVNFSMSEVVAEDVEEEVEEIEEDTYEGVVEGAAAHLENGIDISDVTR